MSKLATAAADIKLAHSVFALPFAVFAAFLVAPRLTSGPSAHPSTHNAGPVDWQAFIIQLGLIVACMFFARTWAMLVNRVADRQFDAANPRTARRAFAAGTLSLRDGIGMLAGSAFGFCGVAACFGFFFGNWIPLIASLPVLAWLGLYSFTKRFTALCHVFLGLALALSPIAAAIAIGGGDALAWSITDANGTHPGPGQPIWMIALMVTCWVAGFDIIYALQDADFDRNTGLHSLPSRLGRTRAIWISRFLHLISLLALTAIFFAAPNLGSLYVIAASLAGQLIIIEHVLLTAKGNAGIPMAFLTCNGLVSLVLGLVGSIDALN